MSNVRGGFDGIPLLNIASYARRGPGRRAALTPAQLSQIHRTVSRAPEVMIKVTGGGRGGSRGVRDHLSYIDRKGELEIETDDGRRLRGKGTEADLIEDWDLDLDEHRKRQELFARNDRKPPKLVHNLVLSMPAHTPPDKVLLAVKDFAREEFGLKHRYAMVLHTDEPHPHVHLVVKAVSEQGDRLNIRKATLRGWRQEFARHLREHDIAANATERAVRGLVNNRKTDGIYRASRRGGSTHMQVRVDTAAKDITKGHTPIEPGKARLIETRREVQRGWHGVIEQLQVQGEQRLAEGTARFIERMPPPHTEREALVDQLYAQAGGKRSREIERTR
jgi:hypothetical protein